MTTLPRPAARWLVPVALLVLALPVAAQDASKRRLEAPVERALERAVEEPQPKTDENPRVAPGLVRWHADFGAAREASARSGKPVLLFQLLGRLDEEFC